MTTATPKPVQQEINRLARCRATLYEIQARMMMREVIRKLVASGMSHEEALQKIYDNPPIVDPNY